MFVISNHDIVRSYNRYGDGKNNDAIAKLMGAFYLTLRGSAIMYYGEELGMQNNDPKRKEDVKDPIGRTGWPNEIGRDGERGFGRRLHEQVIDDALVLISDIAQLTGQRVDNVEVANG